MILESFLNSKADERTLKQIRFICQVYQIKIPDNFLDLETFPKDPGTFRCLMTSDPQKPFVGDLNFKQMSFI
jgi:hypothetical protein